MLIGIRSQFPLGMLLATRNAAEELDRPSMLAALQRHANQDWGNVCKEDAQENDLSLIHGYRLLSVYQDAAGTKFWIITEADRSATTILLPEDY